jgi:exosortase A
MNEQAQSATVVAGKGSNVALPALVIAMLAILVIYRETAMTMVEIWARSGTFTHAFLVPPIALWLTWRVRENIAPLTSRPSAWALLALVGAGFAWLLGELATVRVLSQFALVTMLILTVPAVLGCEIAKRIAFPLAFLYFAVPFGEFALPQLMEWTANMTVLSLRLSGIPVYREGLQFIIPSGSWSVVEACSGLRYIIASLTVGTLFAYLSYRSLKRRLIFIGVSFVVPVIANWLRAYMIVMIGHYSGNKLALGVDHLIYGWLFFGVVIMTMFWIGSRWREDDVRPRSLPSDSRSTRLATNSHPLFAALAVIALVLVWPLAQSRIELGVPTQVTQVEPLAPVTGWAVSQREFSDWHPYFDNPSVVQQSSFGADECRVGLYLGYYRNQDYSRKMVSSGNALVTAKDLQWVEVAGGTRELALQGKSISVRTAELRSADSSRLMVWQWYWINGHLTASDYIAKAYTAFSRVMGQGDDSAVIIVYAPKEQACGGEAALEAFLGAAWPAIESALDRTREKR